MMPLLTRYCLILFFIFFSPFIRANNQDLLAPQQVLADVSNKLRIHLQVPKNVGNKIKTRQFIAQEIFPQVDTILMSALVLGKHWRKASKMQQRKFISAFKQLLVNTYAATFTEQFRDWTVSYSPLKLKGSDKKILVKTHIQQAGKPDTRVNYSMVLRKGKWKIYDMTVEGISLIISNRTIFGTMIKKSGSLDKVIETLVIKNNS
jgi:phospholipid transport system substrate-binding protein